jgi:hypothetical protein
MKRMLIVVGPQGSGNHIFSRLFSMHSEVQGWDEIIDNFWVEHSREYFTEAWIYPELLDPTIFNDKNYFLTNVSFPYNFEGMRYNPKLLEVADKISELGIKVSFAVITRDEGINRMQQTRIRETETIDLFKKYVINNLLNSQYKVDFVNLEAFFSYKEHYLKYLSTVLNFPIDYDNSEILKFIDESPNKKYLKYVDEYWLDSQSVVGLTIDDLSNPLTILENNRKKVEGS